MNCRFLCIALVALLAIVPAVAFSDDREGWEEYLISLYENSEEAAVSVEEAYEPSPNWLGSLLTLIRLRQRNCL